MAPLASAADQVNVVDRPETGTTNAFYISNRAPLSPSPLIKLPVGVVRPSGWLRKQLELQAAGFHGHLEEISQFLSTNDNAWQSPSGDGKNGWEEVPYWLKGYGDCAYLLDNQEQIRHAKVWIEGAMKTQRGDGYFGPKPGTKATVDSTQGKYDLWPQMVMMMCLQSYYEVTKDDRVLELMMRYFYWELAVPEAEFLPPYWQKIRAADNLWSVYWLYNRTGETWLLRLAQKIHRNTANWTDGVCDWHNVNMSQAFGGPATFWMQSHDPKHLLAADRNWRFIRKSYGEVPGGMFGGDENCRPGFTDPRQAIETCGMVEMMFSSERLLEISGDLVWADRCEDVAFNSLPASMTADLKALRYLTAPNLIRSDRLNKSPGYQNGGAMLHMDPHSHRCCQHNVGHGWPYLTEHLWMATPDNGLAAVLYAPGEVKATVGKGENVRIATGTHYPFDETIEWDVTLDKPSTFPLYLRIPGWCESVRLTINGKARDVKRGSKGYVRIARAWANGDRVKVTFETDFTVRTWAANHDSVSVDRGPLTYSLKIGERYQKLGGTETWPAWEIHPTTPWNYGLVLPKGKATTAFNLVRKAWPANDLPFTQEGCPIEVTASGKRIPEWQEDALGLVGLLQASPVKSPQPVEKISLIPMGAARLRIASIPVVGEGADAHVWKAPPALAFRPTASHCNESDTPGAMADGILPKNSHDREIPRFTWWDRKGDSQWVQAEFAKPRAVSSVEVYWFDDTSVGGGCGLPESWAVEYKDGEAWKCVATSTAPVADRFDALRFPEVQAGNLRLTVKLKSGQSGGILEWRVP